MPSILLKKNGEITPERIKRWSQSKKRNKQTNKQKQVVDVTGDRSKLQCCKEQYCIGTWNVRFMNKANWKWSNRRWQE